MLCAIGVVLCPVKQGDSFCLGAMRLAGYHNDLFNKRIYRGTEVTDV